MKVIEQSHRIEFLSPTPLKWMEFAARNSHKSEDKISPGSDERLIKSLLALDPPHETPTEFAFAMVRFITDRGMLAELRTHRLASYLVESTRYVKYDGDMEFIRPIPYSNLEGSDTWSYNKLYSRTKSTIDITDEEEIWLENCLDSERNYRAMRSLGSKPEWARNVLNQSFRTDILMMANLREWRHILKLRTHKAAHPQMRALLTPLLKEFKANVPVVFDDIRA